MSSSFYLFSNDDKSYPYAFFENSSDMSSGSLHFVNKNSTLSYTHPSSLSFVQIKNSEFILKSDWACLETLFTTIRMKNKIQAKLIEIRALKNIDSSPYLTSKGEFTKIPPKAPKNLKIGDSFKIISSSIFDSNGQIEKKITLETKDKQRVEMDV